MKLLVDAMCGGIVTYLRMCGHDTVYALDRDLETDSALKRVATTENRTIVTRDQSLAGGEHDVLTLTTTATEAQLRELQAAGVALTLTEHPEYCGACNGALRVVDPDEGTTTPAHTPDPAEKAVYTCTVCGQYFWRGSHWERMNETLAEVNKATDGY